VFVSFDLGGGSSLGIYTREALAADAGVPPEGSGFGGITFHFIVSAAAEVDALLAAAAAGGARIVRPAQAAQWGGDFGYFAGPDGNLWKVAASA
jgi:hypothetical protein